MNMRKFIIKYWFGVYRIEIGKKLYYPERSIISNLLGVIGIILTFFLVENEDIKSSIIAGLFAIIAFCTVVYFRFAPTTWNDLDEIQKWYYGTFYFKKFSSAMKLPEEIKLLKKEWEILDKKYNLK